MKIFKQLIEIKPLIPELGFVTNKTMWSGHFRQAMRNIPEEDYGKIVGNNRYRVVKTMPVSGYWKRWGIQKQPISGT